MLETTTSCKTLDCSGTVSITFDLENTRSALLSRFHIHKRTDTYLAHTVFTMNVDDIIANRVTFIHKNKEQITHLHAFVQSSVMLRLQRLQRVAACTHSPCLIP